MTHFEFLFSLLGLLLGLSLAEILGGFARTIQARRKIRLGWLTPLAGLLVAIDLLSFWGKAWRFREALAVDFDLMVYLTLLAGIYYVACSLVFPSDHDEWPDLDDYFMSHKAMVLGAVMGVNLLLLAGEATTNANPFADPIGLSIAIFYTVTALAIMFARGRRLAGALLAFMISLYWLIGWVLGALGV